MSDPASRPSVPDDQTESILDAALEPAEHLAVQRIATRVSKRLLKNLPRIIVTLKEQLDADPESDKLKVAIDLEIRHEPNGALFYRANLAWKTTRTFEDKDEGDTFVPNQPDLFPPTRGSADADALQDAAGENKSNADGQKANKRFRKPLLADRLCKRMGVGE